MAGILKFGQPKAHAATIAAPAYQFDDMGASYLDRVRGEAAKIIAEARAEAARIKSQAAEQGKQTALTAVEASLRTRIDQQVQTLLSALNQAVQGIAQSREAWQRHWETHSVRVATAIAGRVVRREIQSSPTISQNLLQEALQLAAGSGRIIVRLNPQDHTALANQAEQLTKQLNLVAPAQIVADPSIASGGCRVETEFGAIDNRVETQLARIAEEMLN